MRYSIIHHDVREKFDLTVAECIVADSISKLCRLGSNGTTYKSNVEIGKFIGYNEITVRRAKEVLLEKELIFEMLGGIGTTPLWEQNSTFYEGKPRHNVESNRQNVEKTVQNVEHSIIKNIKNIIGSKSEDLQVVEITTEEEREPRQKTDTSYRGVFELWGKNYPRNWLTNRTEIQAAKNLLEEHGLEDCKEALAFFNKHKKEEMCPQILKPSDLDRKRANLMAYSNKI